LESTGKAPEAVPNLGGGLQITSDQLYTWTDLQLEELCGKLQLPMPFRREYRTRRDWVESITGSLQLHRVDPVDTNWWKLAVAQ